MSKGGSKVLTAVIAFILGFVFAIIFEVAAVFYVLSADLNTVFDMVGFTNDDGNGNKYINTDENTGGASSVLALVSKLSSISDQLDSYTLGKLEELFPAVDGVAQNICDSLSDYVEISVADIRDQTINELSEYLTDKIMDIQPISIVKMAMDEEELDDIVLAILQGNEASYVTDESGTNIYPVYYDEYVASVETTLGEDVTYYYLTSSQSDRYPGSLDPDEWLVDKGTKDEDNRELYRQYYFVDDNGNYYVTKKDGGSYIYTTTAYLKAYGDAGVEANRLTGYYYYKNSGEKQVVKRVTLSTLSTDPMASLEEYPLTKVEGLGDQEIMTEIFGDISLGDLINGNVDFEELIDDVKLSAIIDISPTNTVMAYLGYSISNVTEAKNASYQYTGTYELESGEVVDCYIETALKGDETVIDRAYYYTTTASASGVPVVSQVEIECCKVGNIAKKINDVTVPALLSVKGDDAIMAYLGYGVYNMEELASFEPADFNLNLSGEALEAFKTTYTGYSYIGKVAKGDDLNDYYVVLVKVNNSTDKIISSVVRADENGEYNTFITGTHIDDLNDRVSKIKDALRIRDVVTIDENSSKFMKKIQDLTIAKVDTAVDILTIDDFITPKTSDTILMYVTYSISKIELKVETSEYAIYTAVYWEDNEAKPIYIKAINEVDEAGNTVEKISYFYQIEIGKDENDNDVEKEIVIDGIGTSINGISSVVGKLTERMTLNEIVHIDSSNTFLYAIRNSTIDYIPTAISKLGLQEVFAKDIYDLEEGEEIKTVVAEGNMTDEETQIVFDESYIYFIKEDDGTLTLVNDDADEESEVSRGKLDSDEFTSYTNAGITLYSYGKPSGAWWFMLSDGKTESVYTVNDMGKLMSNVTNNVKKATITEMEDAGLITTNTSTLEGKNVPVRKEVYETEKIQIYIVKPLVDCTVDQLINAVSYMLEPEFAYASTTGSANGNTYLIKTEEEFEEYETQHQLSNS